LYSVEQKFLTEDEKTQESWIWTRAPKKCAPCFRGTQNFLFIFNIVPLISIVVNSTVRYIRGLGVQESGRDEDPYQGKHVFSRITWIPAFRIWARWKALSSAKIVLSLRLMVIYACGLFSNPDKVTKFQYTARCTIWYSIDQELLCWCWKNTWTPIMNLYTP
jgi:hypothetical protein